MMAALPQAQDKMRRILTYAAAYADLIGSAWVRYEDHAKLNETAEAWKAEAERWRSIAQNRDGGTYVRVVAERNNWKDSAEGFLRDVNYYRNLVLRVGQLLGEEVKVCDDGVNCGEILVDKVPEVAQKTLFQYGEFAREVARLVGWGDMMGVDLKEVTAMVDDKIATNKRLREKLENAGDAIQRNLDLEKRVRELEGDVERYNRLWDEACEQLRRQNKQINNRNHLGHKLFGVGGKYSDVLTIGDDVVLDGMVWMDQRIRKLGAEVANLSLACESRDIVIADKNRHIQDLEAESTRLVGIITEAAAIVGACARDPKGTLVQACQSLRNRLKK